MNIGKYLKMYSEDLQVKGYADNTISNYVSDKGDKGNSKGEVIPRLLTCRILKYSDVG